jgi:hypothetical protein
MSIFTSTLPALWTNRAQDRPIAPVVLQRLPHVLFEFAVRFLHGKPYSAGAVAKIMKPNCADCSSV